MGLHWKFIQVVAVHQNPLACIFLSFWGIFARFRAFFCVLIGFCAFLRVFTCFSPLGALLERSWALLERSWGALGTLLGALGSSWGALGALLELSWALLERSWARIRKKVVCDLFLEAQLGAPNPFKLAQKSFKNRCKKKIGFKSIFYVFLHLSRTSRKSSNLEFCRSCRCFTRFFKGWRLTLTS